MRRWFVWLEFLLTLCLAPGALAAAKPNIIVILSDDQGRGEYGAFGTPDILTPAIDRLYREGMDFVNFRANSPVCSPTRAAMLTGMYPDRAGVPGVIRTSQDNSWGYLRTDILILPQMLKKAGYHTALVGKWHLGLLSPNTPGERGFDFFHGFLGDMMDDYWTHQRDGQNFMRKNGATIRPEGHATDLFTQWACDYIQERAAAPEPFFLYLAFNAPHDPIQPPKERVEKVKLARPGISDRRAGLVAMVEHMDVGIDAVLGTLDRVGLSENTLVIFTSDNGGVLKLGANNGAWRGEKGQMYEGGLRVPFVARWPGTVKPGSSTALPATTMDIFATACDVAGVAVPDGRDAVSFLPALRTGEQSAPGRDLYFTRREGGPPFGGKTIDAVIRGPWKLLQNSPFAPLELYNLEADPYEKANVAGTERQVFNELSAVLRKQIQRGGMVPWQAGGR